VDCGIQINTAKAKRCIKCAQLFSRKTERPTREELKDLIRNDTFISIGKKYNITDNAVRKWCKAMNLPVKKSEIKKYSDEEWNEI